MQLIRLLLIISLAFCVTPSFGQSEACLIIGEESNPADAKEHFEKALKAWKSGQPEIAVDQYEQALMADRSILAQDDLGMAKALIESYRKKATGSQAPSQVLCRLGFFENVVAGNLQSSIEQYEKVAIRGDTEEARILAKKEAARLKKELEYIQNWQLERRKAALAENAKEIKAFLLKEAMDNLENRITEIENQRQSLQQRISYLRSQEKEAQEEMLTGLRRSGRYQRTYYDPNSQFGSTASDSVEPPPNPPGTDSDLDLYYRNRRHVQEQKNRVNHIRSEITGVEKQIKALDKQLEKLYSTK